MQNNNTSFFEVLTKRARGVVTRSGNGKYPPAAKDAHPQESAAYNGRDHRKEGGRGAIKISCVEIPDNGARLSSALASRALCERNAARRKKSEIYQSGNFEE